MERKLTAILSADVKGYSRLMSEDEAATVRTLTAYRELMASLIQQHRGRVVDTPGDNLLAEFASVVDAVQCAAAIQWELKAHNAELPGHRRMEFRIGVNLGDVIVDGERIYGDGVNIAARVEGLAEAGSICISGTAYDHVKNKLALGYESLGEHAVKNIPEPVRVYRVQLQPRELAPAAMKKKWGGLIGSGRWVALAAVVLLLLLAAGGTAVWNLYLRPSPRLAEVASEEKMAFPLPDNPSIAVLPFDNLSGDPEQGYFVDGMTDDLITDLSKISGLFVIARNSVFVYKDKPVKVRQVAEELGVRYVLEGSVRKAGDRVRINAQLIDATTGHHLWAERYDGELGDIFALQDKVTQKIVAALAVRLTPGEEEQLAGKETANPAAYDAFLQGWSHYLRTTADDYVKAVRYFEKAIELDPNYGRAYAGLAWTYWQSFLHAPWHKKLGVSWEEAPRLVAKYLAAAMKNPTPLAHQLAASRLRIGRQYDEALAEAERGLALDPNDADSNVEMAQHLISVGRAEEAIDFVKRAMRLNPHYRPYYLHVLGHAQFQSNQLKEAAATLERALERNPKDHPPAAFLAAAYAHLGQLDKARAAFEKHKRGWPPEVPPTIPGMRWWLFYKDPKYVDRVIDGLVKVGLPGLPGDSVTHPRFAKEVKDLRSVAGKWSGYVGGPIGVTTYQVTIQADGSAAAYLPYAKRTFEWTVSVSGGKLRFRSHTPYRGRYAKGTMTLYEGEGQRVLKGLSDTGKGWWQLVQPAK